LKSKHLAAAAATSLHAAWLTVWASVYQISAGGSSDGNRTAQIIQCWLCDKWTSCKILQGKPQHLPLWTQPQCQLPRPQPV